MYPRSPGISTSPPRAFRCLVTNDCGSVTSNEATLIVCPAGQPFAIFISGQGVGSSEGVGFRRSDDFRIQAYFSASAPPFGEYSARGDTSGGLRDGAISVATFSASFQAAISNIEGWGARIEYHTIDDGRFLEPDDYYGNLHGFLDFNMPRIQLEGGPARLRITGTGRGALVHSMGTIESGGIAPSGTYYLPFDWHPSVTVSDQAPYVHRGDTLIIDLVTPCAGDFNRDTEVTSQDFFDFVTALVASAPAADFNQDGTINSQDFFDFLAAFFAGCP